MGVYRFFVAVVDLITVYDTTTITRTRDLFLEADYNEEMSPLVYGDGVQICVISPTIHGLMISFLSHLQ
jgi:hypothetical protein